MPDRTCIVISGSRNITDYEKLAAVMDQFTAGGKRRGQYEVIHGGARGVDQLADEWAQEYGCPVTVMPAVWEEYGAAAGPVRNEMMAQKAEALIALWDGHSPGTRNMIKHALNNGLDVHVYQYHGLDRFAEVNDE